MKARAKAWTVMSSIVVTQIVTLAIVERSPTRLGKAILLSRNGHQGTVQGWCLGVALAVGFSWYTTRRITFVRRHFFTLDLMKFATLVLFAPVTAVFEEFFFRRVLMEMLALHGYSVFLQMSVSALTFGIAHAVWIMFGGQWRTGLFAALTTTVLGALLAVVYEISQRVLLPALVSHLIINICIEPWLVLAATSKAWRQSADHPDGLYKLDRAGALSERH